MALLAALALAYAFGRQDSGGAFARPSEADAPTSPTPATTEAIPLDDEAIRDDELGEVDEDEENDEEPGVSPNDTAPRERGMRRRRRTSPMTTKRQVELMDWADSQ